MGDLRKAVLPHTDHSPSRTPRVSLNRDTAEVIVPNVVVQGRLRAKDVAENL